MFWITYVVQFYSLLAIFNLLIDNYSKEEILLQIDFIQRSVSYSILDYQWHTRTLPGINAPRNIAHFIKVQTDKKFISRWYLREQIQPSWTLN